jgi:hypothetical protein
MMAALLLLNGFFSQYPVSTFVLLTWCLELKLIPLDAGCFCFCYNCCQILAVWIRMRIRIASGDPDSDPEWEIHIDADQWRYGSGTLASAVLFFINRRDIT